MNFRVHLNCILLLSLCSAQFQDVSLAGEPENFQKENLIAWCIVPFDAKKRGPAERAEMIKEIGLQRVAYDWRAEHVPQFEEEILQYKKHGIEFFAFWSWHENLEPLIIQHDIHPQIWMMLPNPEASTHEEKARIAIEQIMPIVMKTKKLGCKLGFYNHGGWAGDPETMVSICKQLRNERGFDHVGIVYNFHHGHEHIADFKTSFLKMQPYLFCLNLNGMADPQSVRGHVNKIIPIGDGKHEAEMIQTVIENGYNGPIGILDHRNELDSKESLKLNMRGLEKVLKKNRQR